MSFLLILLYSPLQIAAEPRSEMAQCVQEAKSRLGEELSVVAWDNMGGSNPIPRVFFAFCVEGSSIEQKK